MQKNGIEVDECRVDPKVHKGIRKYWRLIAQARKLPRETYDFVIIGFPGQSVLFLALFLFGRKRIVFDAFVSLYDSNVRDRKVHSRYSLAAAYDWFLDWYAVYLAPTILLDTEQHIQYFVDTFSIPRSKFLRVWVGANEEVFHPRTSKQGISKIVHFHGSFIPLQGISYILDAAELLLKESIEFRIVGNGQEYKSMMHKAHERNLSNVLFVGRASLQELSEYMSAGDICLGIFGNTEKTMRVIPNKVFEGMAMGKAIITADTPAIRELSIYGELPLVLVPTADPRALADAIVKLCTEKDEQARVATAAAKFFETYLQEKMIVAQLFKELTKPHFLKV
jgi:glycosyltransferase involved in cell wall biosynthesis